MLTVGFGHDQNANCAILLRVQDFDTGPRIAKSSNLQLELESPYWKVGAVDKTGPALDCGLSAAELRKGPSSAVDGEVCPNDVGRVICC